jgi:hypothetical protein
MNMFEAKIGILIVIGLAILFMVVFFAVRAGVKSGNKRRD